MSAWVKVIAIWLCIDGGASLVFCSDRYWWAQAVRVLRVVLGIVLFFIPA